MVKMRSIPKAVEEIKAADPGTSITVSTLRRWVKEGKVPAVQNGTHFLINMEVLHDIMAGKNGVA